MSFAGAIQTVVGLLPSKPTIETGLIKSEKDWDEVLDRYFDTYGFVENIVIIGHSNSLGLVIAPRVFFPWQDVAQEIADLEPGQMALIACEAGQSYSANIFFDEIPELTDLYASPFKTTVQQCAGIPILLAYLLSVEEPDAEKIFLAQGINFFRTGGWIQHHTPDNRAGNQLLEFIAKAVTRRLQIPT
jgi:hypothetical protein